MTLQTLEIDGPRLLPIYFDRVFKLLFDDSDNARILISFLNAILHLEGDARVESASLSPREVPGLLPSDKQVILDIQAVDQRRRHFSVEMQVGHQGFYRARALYYACGIYHAQLKEGQGYQALRPVYSIHLLCFNLWPKSEVPRIHSVFELRDRYDHRLYTDLLELHVVELEKLSLASLDIVRLKSLDLESAWLYLIRHGHELPREVVEEALPDEVLQAYGRLEMLSQEPDLRIAYLQLEKARRDELAYIPDLMAESRLEGQKEGRAEGRVEGRAEGRVEGRAEGRVEGRAEGRVEGRLEGLKALERLLEQGLISRETFEREKSLLISK